MEKKALLLDLDYRKEEIADVAYSFEKMEFAHASAVKNGTVIPCVCFESCREAVCGTLRDQLMGTKGWHCHEIPLDKVRLVLYFRHPGITVNGAKASYAATQERFRRVVFAGVKLVNAYESKLGWPLTKMYKVKCTEKVPAKNTFFYTVGSRRWIKAPALLSLYLLLLRLGHHHVIQKKAFRTYGTAYKTLKAACKRGSLPTDLSYFKTHGDQWMLILKNYERLFKNRTMTDLYIPSQRYNNEYFHEGINTLCDNDTLDVKLQQEMYKIYKETEKK